MLEGSEWKIASAQKCSKSNEVLCGKKEYYEFLKKRGGRHPKRRRERTAR